MVTKRTKVLLAFAGAAVLALVLVWLYGANTTKISMCGVCGRTRIEEWRCGVRTRDEIRQNDTSAWVDGICPTHQKHTWVMVSFVRRGLFVIPVAACKGGAEFGQALNAIRQGQGKLGEARTFELFEEYRAIVENNPDRLRDFAERLGAEPGFDPDSRE